MNRIAGRAFLVAALALPGIAPALAQEWTRFRGPNGTGIATGKGIPVQFTPADYAWKLDLPGMGHSSPVIWGERLYVTSAVEETKKRTLYCVRTTDGKVLWTVTEDYDQYPRHRLNSHASASAAVDRDRVYLPWWGPRRSALVAYTHEGKEVWRHELGPWFGQHGGALSPVLFEDLVILRADNDKEGPESFIVALEAKSGKPRWRKTQAAEAASYSNPVLFTPKGAAPQLVYTSQALGVVSLNPRTGDLNWQVPGIFNMRTIIAPAIAGDRLLATSGNGAGKRQCFVIQATQGTASVAYEIPRGTPYVPNPIVLNNRYFLWADNGIVTCVKADSGEQVWSERATTTTYSSPICIDGKIYGISAGGEVVVIEASDEFKILGRSQVGGVVHATPAVSGGRLFIRTESQLIAVGGKAS